MRLFQETLNSTTGKLLICDPMHVGDENGTSATPDSAVLRLPNGNGDFNVYTDGTNYFVDINPRILKAAERGLVQVPGCVSTDTRSIGAYDYIEERQCTADDAIASQWAIILEVPIGRVVVWFEEKGTARQPYRGVIGIGPSIRFLLNDADSICLMELEARVAKVLRMKGLVRKSELEGIRELITALHMGGCKDSRLAPLAEAVRLELPRRSSKRSRS